MDTHSCSQSLAWCWESFAWGQGQLSGFTGRRCLGLFIYCNLGNGNRERGKVAVGLSHFQRLHPHQSFGIRPPAFPHSEQNFSQYFSPDHPVEPAGLEAAVFSPAGCLPCLMRKRHSSYLVRDRVAPSHSCLPCVLFPLVPSMSRSSPDSRTGPCYVPCVFILGPDPPAPARLAVG